MTEAVEILAHPASPYSRKLIAALRYRRIPHVVYWNQHSVPRDYPAPSPLLLPTLFTRSGGAVEALTDTTPILLMLEQQKPERSLRPDDPALAFVGDLIEDYADEWLTKPMFHYRWAYQADADNAAALISFMRAPTESPAKAQSIAHDMAARQKGRLSVVGSNEGTAATIEQSFQRILPIVEGMVRTHGFLLGARPSGADFAVYGQLTQLCTVDPTPMQHMREHAPTVGYWIDLMEDLSGLSPQAGDWISLERAAADTRDLLTEIGKTYVPVMISNFLAFQRGDDMMEATVDGSPWTQATFKYQVKCLHVLRSNYQALPSDVQRQVHDILSGTGCEMLFQDDWV